MDIIHDNLDNLFSLWKTAATTVNAHFTHSDYEYNAIEYSEWPNRLWFTSIPITKSTLRAAKESIQQCKKHIIIPSHYQHIDEYAELFQKEGFSVLFKQTGMSLKVDSNYPTTNDISLKNAITTEDAALWEQLFKASFGYEINRKLIEATNRKIQFFIVSYQDKPAGTCILYCTDKIAGIHALGIIPELRRKGVARLIMYALLSEAHNRNMQFATLQASEMGKGLYEQLGFATDFQITNYTLSQKNLP